VEKTAEEEDNRGADVASGRTPPSEKIATRSNEVARCASGCGVCYAVVLFFGGLLHVISLKIL
jgi:hypothetical protein